MFHWNNVVDFIPHPTPLSHLFDRFALFPTAVLYKPHASSPPPISLPITWSNIGQIARRFYRLLFFTGTRSSWSRHNAPLVEVMIERACFGTRTMPAGVVM